MRAALSRRLMDSSSNPASRSFFQIDSSVNGVVKALAPEDVPCAGVTGVPGVKANLWLRGCGLAIPNLFRSTKQAPPPKSPQRFPTTQNSLLPFFSQCCCNCGLHHLLFSLFLFSHPLSLTKYIPVSI